MDATKEIISKPGIYHGLDFADYLAIRAVNASTLKAMARETPKHAEAVYTGRSVEKTPSLVRGSATHAAILEAARFDQEYIIGPEVRRNTNEWKDFAAKNAGKNLLKPSENADVIGMRDAVWSNDFSAKMLRVMDWVETTLVWIDDDTGLLCKARLDLFSTKLGSYADVKTANDVSPKKFGAACYDLAYHIQFAWYGRGLAKHGLKVNSFGILGLEPNEPYDVVVYEPTEKWINEGINEADDALHKFAHCLKSKHWPGYAGDQSVIPLELPRWAA